MRASTPPPFAYEGAWSVEHATLPGGAPAYTGTIAVRRAARAYLLDWDITAGRYVGVGLARGDHLYVGCGETFRQLGVALYYLDAGAPRGEWSAPELDGAVGSARFESPWGGSFEGDHRLVHTSPDGGAQPWDLEVRRAGEVYAITWRSGDERRAGLGLPMPGGIAAGWYFDLQQLAVLDYAADQTRPDQLTAVWALGGFTALGTEKLCRTGEAP